MKMNRRQFTLGTTSLLLSGLVPMKAKSSIYDNKKNLVVIMLRGAMDGLTSVPYIHDNILEKVRPDIFVKKLLNLNFLIKYIASSYTRVYSSRIEYLINNFGN